MDYIFIDELDVPTRIGCTEEERAGFQQIRFSIKIFLPLGEAGKTGRLASTVNYAEIMTAIKVLGEQKEYVLLETFALDVADLILKDDKVRAVQIDASKQLLPGVKRTGISIYRESK